MRKFSVISVMLCLWTAHAVACTFITTHNYYLFHTFEPKEGKQIIADTDAFWKRYVGSKDENFSYLANVDDIVNKATRQNDQEVLSYVKTLNAYLKASDIGFDGWNYPTKEQLAFRSMVMNNTLAAAKKYKGTRLRPHYQLLLMRANMQLKRYNDNLNYWTSVVSKQPASPHRTWMRSLYANALCNTGAPAAAADIYTELGDESSVTWCVRKYRNVAGIRSIYEKAPSSSVLNYLVQDFVNNAQETMDNYQESYRSATRGKQETVEEEMIHHIGGEPVYLNEVRQFIAFANQVAQEGRTPYPCMWKSAAGALHFLLGENDEAAAELDEAMRLNGTQLMKDNAHAIAVVVEAAKIQIGSGNTNQMVEGLAWLEKKAKTNDHYSRVMDRLLYLVMAERYDRMGDQNRSLAAIALANEIENGRFEHFSHLPKRPANADDWCWNPDYSSEYAAALDSLSGDQLVSYFNYLNGKPATDLDRFMQQNVYRNADYFNDRIGTRYLAEGQFAKAIPYLKKVSLAFLEMQNISYRLVHQDFTAERWFNRQLVADDKDGPYGATPTQNQKQVFCEKVLALQKLLGKKKTNTPENAYQLATLYYQASYWGDCWHLTRYGHSVYDSREEGEFDFVGEAITLLEQAATSTNNDLRGKSLFALAYIPLEPWYETEWVWNDPKHPDGYEKYILHPTARQYRSLNLLNDFVTRQHSVIDGYASHCDVLKTFRKQTRG